MYIYIHGLPWWLSGKEAAAMQEICIRSLGWEDSLEKDVATLLGILAWKVLSTEEPGVRVADGG